MLALHNVSFHARHCFCLFASPPPGAQENRRPFSLGDYEPRSQNVGTFYQGYRIARTFFFYSVSCIKDLLLHFLNELWHPIIACMCQ